MCDLTMLCVCNHGAIFNNSEVFAKMQLYIYTEADSWPEVFMICKDLVKYRVEYSKLFCQLFKLCENLINYKQYFMLMIKRKYCFFPH